MNNIRKLNIFDKKQLEKIAGLSSLNSDYFKYNILKECACSMQCFLPLKLKSMPEAYVLTEEKSIKGMISIAPTGGNPEQINITRLLFENNDYQSGKELINFIVRHYGELGAKSFKVVIDNNHKDLEQLFMNGCGFRCCSYENLWDISHDIKYFRNITPSNFDIATDFHIQDLTELYNSALIPYYRPTLERNANEFKEPFIKIFDNKYENRYILTDHKRTVAYLTVKTNDNYNFIITITKNDGYQLGYDNTISFALKSIESKRNSQYKAYLKQKKYLKFSQDYESYLHSRNYECIQTQHVLVKEFYKPIKQEFQAFIFGENKLLSNQ